MLQLVFDKAAIKHNIAAVKKRAEGATIYAMLLSDGYGAGLVELANLLRDDGIGHFAVNQVADAKKLRKAGFVEEEILMLRSTTDPEELNRLLDLNVVCTIGSYETGVALNALAEERSTIAVAHVLVDTGMGLGGFLPSEPEKLLSIYKYLPNVAIAGTYTQLYSAGGDINAQMSLFQSTLDTLHAQGLETGITHAASSSVLMRSQGVQLDAVRVGVLSLGYRNGFGMEPDLGGGFWGWLRAFHNRKTRRVTFQGEKARLLGPIGADETAVDVTDLKCVAGDVVCFDINPLFAKGMTRVFR